MDRIYGILKDFKTGLPNHDEQKLAHLIYEESFQYQYDPELILAVIVTESSFYNWSRSRVGAIGLMQIMPTTGFSLAKAGNISWIGNATLFNPYLNIKLGIKYLAMMHDQFDDLEIALTAYNYGPTRVSEMLKRCERLPRDYSQKVLSKYKRFLELEPGDPVVS
jgi:soluble lytic murein transglycosylase